MVDFNIIFILILTTFIIIGYLTGATIEIFKLIKIYVPFIVVFYIGGPLSRFVFKLKFINDLINNVKFIHDLPFRNTLIMLLCTIIAFMGSYFIIGIIINIIKKQLQKEMVSIKLGKINNFLGAIIASVRGYVVISLLVLPFYLLGLTNTENFSTNLILKYPPPFTQIGHLIHSGEPVLNASNSLASFLEVIDINQMRKNYETLTNLNQTLSNYDDKVKESCTYTPNGTRFPYLNAYISDSSKCNKEEVKKILPYKGLIKWVIDENIPLDTLIDDDLLTKFQEDYQFIYSNTTDQKMKNNLSKAKEAVDVYLVVNHWLKDTLGANYIEPKDVLNDTNMELIMEQLVVDINKSNGGFFYELSQLDNPSLPKKIEVIKKFVHNYTEVYKPVMRNLPDSLDFKYKLIASTLKSVDFLPALERTPLISMYIIDAIQFLEGVNNHDESIYRYFVKITIPLYLLETDGFGIVETLTAQKLEEILTKKCDYSVCSIDEAFDKVLLTDEFLFELFYALTDELEGKSYLEELVEIDSETNKALIDIDAVEVLEDYFNQRFKDYQDNRIEIIQDVFQKVGDLYG